MATERWFCWADVDAKVDAIIKLQAEFEAGCEVRPGRVIHLHDVFVAWGHGRVLTSTWRTRRHADPGVRHAHPGREDVSPHAEPAPDHCHTERASPAHPAARYPVPRPNPAPVVVDFARGFYVIRLVVPGRRTCTPTGPHAAHAGGRGRHRSAGRQPGTRQREGEGDVGRDGRVRVPLREHGLAHEQVEGGEGPRDAAAALRAVLARRRADEQGLARQGTGAWPFSLSSPFLFGVGEDRWADEARVRT